MQNKENTDVEAIKQQHAQLETVKDDPRVKRDGHKVVKAKGGGRNTESFDPKSTLVRPAMRICVGPNREVLDKSIKHDDVIVVPEFFCKEDDWTIYYKLVEEMRASQASGLNKSEWISWHEGAHLISMNPTGSPTFNLIQQKISKYFSINNSKVGTRFNWYKDGTDWKPFHHDSAAFNPQRARNQNITVGVSFGASRELAFLHAKDGQRIYFPQTNGMLFSFGRDVNINWKHGINALSEEEISAGGANALGRVSIILWGLCPLVIEESGSPELLTDNTRGNGHSVHARPNDRGGRDQRRDDYRPDDRRDPRRDEYRPDDRRDDGHRDDRRDDPRDYRGDNRNDRRDDRRDYDRNDRDDRRGDRRGRDDSRDRQRGNDGGRRSADRQGDRYRNDRDGGRDQGREVTAGGDSHRRGDSADRAAPAPRDDARERGDNKRSSGAAEEGSSAVCRDFRRGSCRFGDRCKFAHTD